MLTDVIIGLVTYCASTQSKEGSCDAFLSYLSALKFHNGIILGQKSTSGHF